MRGIEKELPKVVTGSEKREQSGLSRDNPVVENGNGFRRTSEASFARQEEILSEVSHEVGNFFHKLYYWAEYLGNRVPAADGECAPGEMLEGTIRRLEGFLKIVLKYVAPAQLKLTRMTAGDVLNSFLGKLRTRLCGTPLNIARPEAAASAEIRVDPACISEALNILVNQVARYAGDESRIEVAIETAIGEGHRGIEIRVALRHPVGQSESSRDAEADVEWALAEKFFFMHEGNISHRVGEGDEVGFGMFLPASI